MLDTNDDRVHWPIMLTYRESPLNDHILPSEVDYDYFEFMLPTNVETFRIYTYLSTGKTRKLGWSEISVYTIKDDKAVQLKEPEN